MFFLLKYSLERYISAPSLIESTTCQLDCHDIAERYLQTGKTIHCECSECLSPGANTKK